MESGTKHSDRVRTRARTIGSGRDVQKGPVRRTSATGVRSIRHYGQCAALLPVLSDVPAAWRGHTTNVTVRINQEAWLHRATDGVAASCGQRGPRARRIVWRLCERFRLGAQGAVKQVARKLHTIEPTPRLRRDCTDESFC